MKTARLLEKIALGLGICPLILQLSTILVSAQGSGANTEPSGPKPSAAVEKVLSEATQLVETKQPADSLSRAEEALKTARQANDKPGEAFAQQARAKALQDLQRKDEASTAWQEASRLWAETGNSPEQVTALVHAGLLILPDKKSDAERLFAQGLLTGKSESPRPSDLAHAFYDTGVLLGDRKQEESKDYLRSVFAVSEQKAAGTRGFIETLIALSKAAINLAMRTGDDATGELARDYAARAVELGHLHAPDSTVLVRALHLQGYAEDQLSNGAGGNAPEHYLAALELQKKLVPDGSLEEAEILRDLGNLQYSQGKFSEARQLVGKAVAIGERLAPESPEFAHALQNLGNAESTEGDLAAAREHMQRALAIQEKLKIGIAPMLINLGGLAYYEGDYAAAREYFEKALELFMKVKGKIGERNLGVPIALADLGQLYEAQGDLATAREFCGRALAIVEAEHPQTLFLAGDLNEMAEILRKEGRLSEAHEYYQRALAIREKIAPDSLLVSETLEGLAQLARARHDPSMAMKYEIRALEMAEKSCSNLWCTPKFLTTLGELAYEQGDLAGSENYLRRAVDIREQSLGPNHPDLARSLDDLAITLAAQGRNEEALADALVAEKIGANHLRVSARTLSERQALAYESIRVSGLDLALTLAASPASTPSTRTQVLDAVIHSRALVFDELAARHRSAYGSGNLEIKQLSDQLLSARTRLATLVFRGAEDSKPEVYRKLLDDATEQKERAEKALAERSLEFRQDQARSQIALNEISAALPPGAALLAYVQYSLYQLRPPSASNAASKPIPSYAAFVLRAGEREPEFVRLSSVLEIDRLVGEWRRSIAQQAEAQSGLGDSDGKASQRLGAELRRRIWDPLLPALANAQTVFVVPDASLHLVNLAALPAGQGRFLIESGPLIHYLSAERDLVPSPTQHGEGLLVVGNPAFDQAGKVLLVSNQQLTSAAPPLMRSTRSTCGHFQTLRFLPLPATQHEVEQIAALWSKTTLGEPPAVLRGAEMLPTSGPLVRSTGADASLEAFLQEAPGKRVLHVATHGFFLEGNCESATQRWMGTDTRNETFLPATVENPLLLSGLAFAGANRRTSAKPEESDGILTAEEIAGINLEGVDWAVLSACDTGVGEIKVGEGVFGLRRAFQVAGAKTVIMSLWSVEDETTRQWMETLYREHFAQGKNSGESVRNASLRILRQRRAKHQSTDPFYWGAFIAVGDWH
jgi:CHAT domain-containing protein/Tfp pilus assembly protein PilF